MWKKNKQSASGVDASTILQANGDINYGVTYLEAKSIAMDVFKANFYDLGKDVEEIINSRADKLISKLLENLSANPDILQRTVNPDIRFQIYEAQKNYARLGTDDCEELLVELLTNRIQTDNQSDCMVTNKAISLVADLSKLHCDLLSFIMLVTSLDKIENKKQMLKSLKPYEYIYRSKNSYNDELMYLASLGLINLGMVGGVLFDEHVSHKIERKLSIDLCPNFDELTTLKMFWNSTSRRFLSVEINPTGKKIAIINAKDR